MIYSLTGKLKHHFEGEIIIDVHGVGYQVFISDITAEKLPAIDSEICIYTSFVVREDAHTLYGFLHPDERQFFLTLTSVSGVGPKVAVKILSGLKMRQVIDAILKEDLAVLTSVSGVGKKMAERLILELKDKLSDLYPATEITTPGNRDVPTAIGKPEDEIVQALKTLGYNAEEIKRAWIKSAVQLKPNMPLEESIRVLLRHL